jgi:hypothetical protein
MSRRTTAKKRLVSPDPIYRSRLVSMIMSRLLQDGKKSLARRLFYESMEHVERLAGSGAKSSGTDSLKTTEPAPFKISKCRSSNFGNTKWIKNFSTSSFKCNSCCRSKIKTCRWFKLSSTLRSKFGAWYSFSITMARSSCTSKTRA